jgi:hypothetical protein
MKDKQIVDDVVAASPNRRSFLNKIAIASAAVAAGGSMSKFAQGAPTAPTDADILNFALNLEYLEAEFYTVATLGMTIDQVGIGITGTGTAGATTGGSQVTFTNSTFKTSDIAMQIGADERAHVTLIRSALTAAGAQPIAKPAINLNALGIGFAGVMDFLQLARAFEDIGVTAYAGAAPLITDKGILGYAARIAQAEASHSENIRLQIAVLGVPTTALDSLDILPPPSGTNYFPLTSQGLTQTRTPGQVLYLAFGNQPNATSGGFFPSGVNGTINMSSNPAANNGTTAVVTPATLTTAMQSITLDGSGSTSGSGALTYLYKVLPGGKVPALLQTAGNPVVTVEFVNGPGTYIVQLTVTDAGGSTAISQPIVLMYTGM